MTTKEQQITASPIFNSDKTLNEDLLRRVLKVMAKLGEENFVMKGLLQKTARSAIVLQTT